MNKSEMLKTLNNAINDILLATGVDDEDQELLTKTAQQLDALTQDIESDIRKEKNMKGIAPPTDPVSLAEEIADRIHRIDFLNSHMNVAYNSDDKETEAMLNKWYMEERKAMFQYLTEAFPIYKDWLKTGNGLPHFNL